MSNNEFFQSLEKVVNVEEVATSMENLGVKLGEDYQPERVLVPNNIDELVAIVKLANEHKMPLYPIGNGSRFVSGVLPFNEGVLISLGKMASVIEYRPDNMSIEVEAGLKVHDLQEILAKDEIFFPINPGKDCTVGGLIATNAYDHKKFLYKTTRFYVMGMEYISPQGEVIKVGGRTIKNVSSYDLHQLLTGSWGTLGIITKAILRVKPLPEKIVLLDCLTQDYNELLNIIDFILFKEKTNLASLVFEQLDSGFFVQVGLEGFAKTIELQEKALQNNFNFKKSQTVSIDFTKANGQLALPLKNYLVGIKQVLEVLKQYPDIKVKGNATSGLIYLGVLDIKNILLELTKITETLEGDFVFNQESLTRKDKGFGLTKLLKDIKNKVDPNHVLVPSSRVMKE
ncbi:MAG: FAD-binding oxidoreductase [Peptococcales bacterium]|jgi:glycolate oxidase